MNSVLRIGWSQFSAGRVMPMIMSPILITILTKNRNASFLDIPDTANIIKGNYENKVRRGSPIEKIFEVFASQKNEDGLFMTFFDVFRAVCPFNYSTKETAELKEYLKENPPKVVMKLIDLDQSGDVSVVEYHIFWILHEINIPDLKLAFENTPQIKKDQFRQFLDQRGKDANVSLTETYLPDGRAAKITSEDVKKSMANFIDNLYNGKQTIELDELISIKRGLRDEIYAFEFNSFNLDKNSCISPQDFAKSIISYSEPKKINSYLNNIKKLNLEGSISFMDYLAFKEFVIDDLDEFEDKMNHYGIITKRKYTKYVNELSSDNEHKLTPLQIDIIFRMLDSDGNGRVEHAEYMSLLKNAKKLGRSIEDNAVTYSMAPIKDLKTLGVKWVDKAHRIWDIIMEDSLQSCQF